MKDTFVLRIQLGNDGMQYANDVAEALMQTAKKIESNFTTLNFTYGYVIDINGNNVGEWEVQ